MRCSSCDASAIVDQPYRGSHLCGDHLRASVEERVAREIRRQLPRFSEGTVGVALSGGKDSAVALQLTAEHFRPRPRVHVVALTVDEGIAGYRTGTIRSAERLSAALGVSHRVVRAETELGTTTDLAASQLPDTVPCSFCGVWRRRLLNRAAREAGADALVLGFNLDDLAQTVLMNLVRGDLDRLVRMAPHRAPQAGFVPRVAPLALVPEREVFLYARLRNLPFDHAECPHASRASRNLFRELVWQLEEAHPGTRQALLRTHERLVSGWLRSGDLLAPGRCRSCGEPSTGTVCRACEYLRAVHGPAAAPGVTG